MSTSCAYKAEKRRHIEQLKKSSWFYSQPGDLFALKKKPGRVDRDTTGKNWTKQKIAYSKEREKGEGIEKGGFIFFRLFAVD